MNTNGLPLNSAWVSVTSCSGHGFGVSEQYGSTPRWSSAVGVSNGANVAPMCGIVTWEKSYTPKSPVCGSVPLMFSRYKPDVPMEKRNGQYAGETPVLCRSAVALVTRLPWES